MGGWTTRRGPLLLLLLGVCLCPASAFSMAAAGGAMGGAADLYIVGCGYLGKILGKGWLQAHPGCAVVGETNTEGKHEDLKSLGITPALRSARGATKFPNVVFCAPPSGSEDYPAEVAAAAKELWDGSGSFVFTSSGGVYAPAEDGQTLTESSPLGDGPQQMKLVQAEKACRDAAGTALRFSGLYSAERGAHSFWIAKGEVNLLSYEDAAGAVAACLAKGGGALAGQALLASDDTPMTREQICQVALSHSLFQGKVMPTFTGEGTVANKFYDCSRTRELLGWQPKYKSFASYMEA